MEGSMTQCNLLINGDVLEGFVPSKLNSKTMQRTVKLPDGITTIGTGAMMRFRCERLVMPPSLTTIKSAAFCYSDIDVIDFSGCKLKRIEDQAFVDCKTNPKATLPDTVEFIGTQAIKGLYSKRTGKITLPRSLRYIDKFAVDLRDIGVLEVEESLVTKQSGLEELILFTQDDVSDRKWLILNVRRNGKLVARAPFSFFEWYNKHKIHFICENDFNYSTYDYWFDNSRDQQLKATIGAFRAMFPRNKRAYVNFYRDHVIDNFCALMRGFEEDTETIKFYDEAGFATPDHLMQLLENARKKNNVDVTATILDLLNSKNRTAEKSLVL
ncbi:MAG: leucine-rich repeat domain-containing protein [Clostridiales bacterium]|jgi:hypothetical protein|nr:leucine-rich repeat domain-containing protein [Clostridiales bacterium]